jgi:hypothetical protein
MPPAFGAKVATKSFRFAEEGKVCVMIICCASGVEDET